MPGAQDSGAATVKYRTTNEVLNKVISGADVWLLGGAVAIKVRRNGNVEYLSVCSAQGPGRET